MMTRRYESMKKKAMPLLAAGMLLQTGGCDTNELMLGWFNSILGAWVQSLVLGSFNLV